MHLKVPGLRQLAFIVGTVLQRRQANGGRNGETDDLGRLHTREQQRGAARVDGLITIAQAEWPVLLQDVLPVLLAGNDGLHLVAAGRWEALP